MVFSAFTINTTSTDLIYWDQKTNLGLMATAIRYMKLTPFFVPTILSKTGTLAFVFSSLKYYGVLYFVAWGVAFPSITRVALGSLDSGSVFEVPFNSFTLFVLDEVEKKRLRLF